MPNSILPISSAVCLVLNSVLVFGRSNKKKDEKRRIKEARKIGKGTCGTFGTAISSASKI